jgi:tRNA (guanine37-N1)-methyltransferase
MIINILTQFPAMFGPVMEGSILGRAQEAGLLDIRVFDIREWSADKHRKTDDTPFGGGAGMVMTPQPAFDALRSLQAGGKRVLYMSPRGRMLDYALAQELAAEEEFFILCGHYEGVDQRVLDRIADEEISVGDYVVTGGELPALILTDAVARMCDNVLPAPDAYEDESHFAGLLEYPQYTRPRVFEGDEVPEVLLNGDHKKIAQWRREQALLATARLRPDLLGKAQITDAEKQWIKEQLAEKTE